MSIIRVEGKKYDTLFLSQKYYCNDYFKKTLIFMYRPIQQKTILLFSIWLGDRIDTPQCNFIGGKFSHITKTCTYVAYLSHNRKVQHLPIYIFIDKNIYFDYLASIYIVILDPTIFAMFYVTIYFHKNTLMTADHHISQWQYIEMSLRRLRSYI